MKRELSSWKVDGLVIENPIDIYYLLGLSLSTGKLLLTKEETILLVDGRYIESAKEKSIVPAKLLGKDALASFFRNCKKVGFDSGFTSVHGLEQLKKEAALDYEPIYGPTLLLRRCKDDSELEKIRQSAALNWEGFCHILKILRDGISELEVAFSYEMFVRQKGAEKLAFDPIIAFGKNSAKPHHRSSSSLLEKGQVVLIDIGVCLDHYYSDMTRVVFWGKENPTLHKMYGVVKEAYAAAERNVCKGTLISSLDETARTVMRKAGMEEQFLHSLGHGVGLEIHEAPRIRKDLECGNLLLNEVITIEPGLYVSGLGGIRYENTLIVTEKGFENLYPKEHPL